MPQSPEEKVEKKKMTAESENAAEKTPLQPSAVYENSAAKAEDNKSSAYLLLIFGVVGMIIMILGIAGVLPIRLSGTTKYMTYGVMSALFLLFIVMGMVSMKSYRIFAKKAESENSLRSTMEKWCFSHFEAKELDEELFEQENGCVSEEAPASVREEWENMPEEEMYFKRVSLMKEKIQKQFLNLDEGFLEHFVDELYGEIFEQ
ncbi:MAG: hypothetical protein K2I22_15615 [Lachnospiraceae bacterium]|nr:hypothetical protein [Lachnospiraceae bacterium]